MRKNRTFKQGRGSEQLLNEELYSIFLTTKDLNPDLYDQERLVGEKAVPDNIVHGALWRKDRTNELKYYDANKKQWINVYDNKFQLIEHLVDESTPADPIKGQLWIYNGILLYFDGKEWKPIKSIPATDAQFNESAFSDFAFVSPLASVGNVVIASLENGDVQRYENKLMTGYQKSKQDVVTEDTEWDHTWQDSFIDPVKKKLVDDNHRTQYVIPSVLNDRVFIESTLVDDYEKVSSVCFQYPTVKTDNKILSALHINHQKVSNITKRLFKINKDDSRTNAIVECDPTHTEFYGFRSGNRYGDHLYPYVDKEIDVGITNSTARTTTNTVGIKPIDEINKRSNPDLNYDEPENVVVANRDRIVDSSMKDDPDHRFGDYAVMHKKIALNYRTVQKYDYILAISYEYNWINYTGTLKKLNNGNLFQGFHIPDLPESINLFFDGLMLEERFYDTDLKNNLVKLEDKIYKEDEVHVFKNFTKDYGYIVETNLDNYGIISLHKKFKSPLVFVAGELIHPTFGGLIYKDDKIFVPRAKVNMPWTVIEAFIPGEDNPYAEGTVNFDSNIIKGTDRLLNKGNRNYDWDANEYYNDGSKSLIIQEGQLSHNGQNVIYYNPAVLKDTDSVIFFLDGMLINPKNIVWNKEFNYLTVKDGLFPGQKYLLLRDPDDRLIDSANLVDTYYTGTVSESLVYVNGKLICNQQPLISPVNEKDRSITAGDGEVVLFMPDDEAQVSSVKIWDTYKHEWRLATTQELKDVKLICTSYENSITSVKIKTPVLPEDSVNIYSFKFAGYSENRIRIGDFKRGETDTEGLTYLLEFDKYAPRMNSLTVFRNGVRQVLDSDYVESEDGKSIKFLWPAGSIKAHEKIHYTIETSDTNRNKVMDVVVLDNNDSIGTNVYKIPDKSDLQLYPGRLVVYRNGVRLPDNEWTLLGNKTIQIIKTDRPYIGTTKSNFPRETYFKEELDYTYEIEHHYPDRLIIEIRQDYGRKEATFLSKYNRIPEYPIKDYDIDPLILESKDEVLFYINGLFTGLSRNMDKGYLLNKYKSCITFMDPKIAAMIATDPLYIELYENPLKMEAWKERTGLSEYKTSIKHYITYDYRTGE